MSEYFSSKERESLSGYLAFEPGEIKNYTPAAIKKAIADKKKWPSYSFRKIDSEIQDKYITVYNGLLKKHGKKTKVKGGFEYVVSDEMNLKFHVFAGLKVALTGWNNHRCVDGKQVVFKTGPDGMATDDCVNSINWRLRDSLHVAIMTGDVTA